MLLWIRRGVLLVALTCLGLWVWIQVDARVYQAIENRHLDRLLLAARHARADVTRPADRQRPDRATKEIGPLVGRLEIPRLHYSAIVAEGIDARTLRRAVGHLPGTPLPGDAGNVVLAGHRDSFFRILKDVQPHDRLRLATPGGSFEYTIVDLAVVDPDETRVLEPSAQPTLTLITCYPFDYIGPAPRRFVVTALETDA
ncbi:MAG TPA: class D sortase [Dongiaceae bacterium]|nr:class D sortase [Dongiaceae bacterium]